MMNLKFCYFSFFVLIYDWIRLDVISAEKVIGLDAGTSLDDEDTDLGLVQKRFISRAIDPLIRRSPLDKNFMRFGKRNEEKGHQEDKSRSNTEDDHELDEIFNIAPSDYKLVSEETESKPKRIKQDFIRLGRGKQDFIRFGRGKQDFIRFGRGKQDFIRFGRGKQDFIRFGRSDLNNLMHYRAPDENFELEVLDDDLKGGEELERDPRAKNSFIRFGRADNFIRFGRNGEIGAPADNINYRSKRSDDEFRFTRGGDSVPALFVADVNPVEIRRSSGFIRLGRSNHNAARNKDLEAGERRKRSLGEELETTTTPEPKIVPKIGFKGLVVVPPETDPNGSPEMDSEGGNGNETGDSAGKNELNDFPATEQPPEKSFHIPSIRHKRRAYDLEKSKYIPIGSSNMLGNNLLDALASSVDYSPVARLRPSSSKDYLVKIG